MTKSLAQNWLEGSTGLVVTQTPERVEAKCVYPSPASPNGFLRATIAFDPGNPASVERASRAALMQRVPHGMCGEHCQESGRCLLRALEDPGTRWQIGIFGGRQ